MKKRLEGDGMVGRDGMGMEGKGMRTERDGGSDWDGVGREGGDRDGREGDRAG